MIVEERIYTMHPGRTADYLAAYEQEGLAIQSRILGSMLGYYTTEIGELNLVIHLWAYENLADRELRRAKLAADAGWKSYVKKIQPMILTQKNRILKPAPFFAARLASLLKAVAQ
jgi:hypothetical protein